MPKVMRQKRRGDALSELCTHGRSMLHYMLASAEEDIFSVETHPTGFNVEQPTNDILVHGNHYVDARFKAGDNAIPEVRGSTYVRVQRLKRLIERNYGDITPQKMMELMADHDNYPHAICDHPNDDMPIYTQSMKDSSVIMVPEDKVMYATCGPPCEHEYSTHPHDITHLGAEIEIKLGEEEEIHVINKTSGVYLPHGLKHNFIYKKVDEPHFLVGFSMSGEYK